MLDVTCSQLTALMTRHVTHIKGNVTFQNINLTTGLFDARIAATPNEYNFVCTFDHGHYQSSSHMGTSHCTLTYEWSVIYIYIYIYIYIKEKCTHGSPT